LRGAEQQLEVRGVDHGPVGLGKEREDSPAVVVDDHERAIDPAIDSAEQTVRVVEEAEVAEQPDDRTIPVRGAGRGNAEHGRREAVRCR